MTKENIITPIIVIGLSLAFITVSLLVSVLNGNSKLVKAKLKIGALIITLTAFVNTNSFSQKTCYKTTAISAETISFDTQSENLTIKIHEGDKVLSGKIENFESNQYFFTISDSADKVIHKGEAKAIDGKFDSDKENFEIHLGKLTTGNYALKIFSSKEKYDSNYYTYKASLIVEEKFDKTKVTCYYY